MEDVGKEGMKIDERRRRRRRKKVVLMWGYLPGATPQRTPLLRPLAVEMPARGGDDWSDVCGGGCGFAMAVSETGKLLTWGSADDMGPSYVASGKHEETPVPYPLPNDASVVKAAAGWAHCVTLTAAGEVYTWGWKECVPLGKAGSDQSGGGPPEKDDKHGLFPNDQDSPMSQSYSTHGTTSSHGNGNGEEITKRRRYSSVKQSPRSSFPGDETCCASPCLIRLGMGVRIANVAAGGRHTLALSDIGQVWCWGYGGEGQLGLGSRIHTVSSPQPIPCIKPAACHKDRSLAATTGNKSSDGQVCKITGTSISAIACGGRHSAVITDTGVLLTFGWGLYGQCGQGSTDDELSPTCVSSLLGVEVKNVAAGLWHTLCTSADGDVYAFGGNQFGQLGTGSDQAETVPKLLDAPCLENKNAKRASCGARHSAVITEDGEVFCWGWNKYGQLGLGDTADRNIPNKVPVDTLHLKNVSCGWWHTLALAESVT